MEFLGWYTTGGDPDEADIQLHQQICEINESPIFLKLNPLSKEAEVQFLFFNLRIWKVSSTFNLMICFINLKNPISCPCRSTSQS